MRARTSWSCLLALLAPLAAAPGADSYPTSYPTTGTTSSYPTTSGGTTNPYAVPGAPERPAFTTPGYRSTFTAVREPTVVTFTLSGACDKPAVVGATGMTSFAGSFSAIERWESGGGQWHVVRLEGSLEETATTIDTVAGSIATDTDRYQIASTGLTRTSRSHRKDSATERHDWIERWANGKAASREGMELTTTRADHIEANGTQVVDERTHRLRWTGPLTWTRESTTALFDRLQTTGSHSTRSETVITERSLFPGTTVVAGSLVTLARTAEEQTPAGPLQSSRVYSEERVSRSSPEARPLITGMGHRHYRQYDFNAVLVEERADYDQSFADGSSVSRARTTTYDHGEPAGFTFTDGGLTFALRWRDGRLVAWQDFTEPALVEGRPDAGEAGDLLKAYNWLYLQDPGWRSGGVPNDAYPFRPYIEAPQGAG